MEHVLDQETPVNQQGQALDFRDIVNTIFKYKYIILTVSIVVVVLAVIGYYIYPLIIPPQYKAQSTILVKFGREFLKEALYQPELSGTGQASPFARSNFIGSEIQILKSRELKEKVLATSGIKNIYPTLSELPSDKISSIEIAILIFETNLDISAISNSDVIQVSFTHNDPHIAAKVVNLLVDSYQVKRLDILTDPRTISFLKQLVDEYSNKVKEAEHNLSAFKKKYGIYSYEEQKVSLLKQATDVDTALKKSQNRIVELKQTLSFLENQIQIIPKFLSVPTKVQGVENPFIAELESKLIELKLKEHELLQKYKETNTWVVNLRMEIRLIEDLIEKENKKIQSSDNEYDGSTILGVNPTYQQMELEIVKNKTELKALEVKEKNLLQQREQLSKDLQKFYLHDRTYTELLYELSETEKNYQTLYKKYEEASISEQMDKQKMTSVSVIQKATPPLTSLKERKSITVFVAGGIFMGLCGGVGLAILLQFISKVVSTPEKAEKVLGIPVLVTIPLKKHMKKL
jgi:uncharacterized protein involved in exopolysaccharide biosynthesis